MSREPKPNRLIAENIASGFDCGNCHGIDAAKRHCVSQGCADLRVQIKRALDAKDRRCRVVCKQK